jgi:hypothetical protein
VKTLSRFWSKPTAKYRASVKALEELLMESKDRDIVTRAFAEAVSEHRLSVFAEKHGATPWRGHICVCRLWGKRCPSFSYPYEGCPKIPCADHLSMWNKDGQPWGIVSQPYGPLDGDHIRELVKFCDQHDLEFEIDAFYSWHFPGETLLILLTRRDT